MLNQLMQSCSNPVAFGVGGLLITLGAGLRPTGDIEIERLDAALDAIVPVTTKVERVAEGFKWPEGPIWVQSAYLLFAEIPSNSIRKWTPDGGVSVFMQPSGYAGQESFNGVEPGSNGMTLDTQGRLTIAGHAARNVYRLESPDPRGPRTVLGERYEGKRLNSPNDLVYRSDGSLYFTDPPYGLESQSDTDPKKELSFNGVFRIPNAISHPAGASPDDSKLQLIIEDLTRPNGIAFSPDEKYLYIAVSDRSRKVWMRYDVQADGTVANGSVLLDATSDTAEGSPDGIKVDRNGNLYGSGPGGLWIISAEGRHLGTVKIPEKVSNCNWGGADSRDLYITASSSVYRMRLPVAGVRPQPR
jgi:gluconolactonase